MNYGQYPQGQYPQQGMPGQYPQQGMPGQYPQQNIPGYPQQGMPGQYPQQGMPGYPQQGMPGQYPQQGMPGQYPQQGMPGQYPQQGMPGMQGQFPGQFPMQQMAQVKVLAKGDGISDLEYQNIVGAVNKVFQENKMNLGNVKLSTLSSKAIKGALGGEWLVIYHKTSKIYDFSLTAIHDNDFLVFSLDNEFQFEVFRMKQ